MATTSVAWASNTSYARSLHVVQRASPTGVEHAHETHSGNEVEQLRRDILAHIAALGLPTSTNTELVHCQSKADIRAAHRFQHAENMLQERLATSFTWHRLLDHFADGDDIHVPSIDPELVEVRSEDETGALFRFATLLWSVPVSRGFGRRMRYLVRDRNNGKLIGLFALGDPVFNLRARDAWIGWTSADRRQRLVNVMDAYVVGAVPPYAQLLGGKLVTSLIASAEVSAAFHARYNTARGVISQEHKGAQLALVTVTSALGRSSLYNRLKLTAGANQQPPLVELLHIGSTRGYGHFHLSHALFERLHQVLIDRKHPYVGSYRFGRGPNWRMRVIRVGLQEIGLSAELLRHGISRDVYAMPLATNVRQFLCGGAVVPRIDRRSASQLASAALERWVLPRARRRPDYVTIKRQDYLPFVPASMFR